MWTLLFIILMLSVFGKLAGLAFRATWGITKICFRLVFLPLALIAMAVCGLMYIALPVLVVVGIVVLVKALA